MMRTLGKQRVAAMPSWGNLQLLNERGWIDVPVVYNNNRRAIVAMEKGASGERAFADAFKVWEQ